MEITATDLQVKINNGEKIIVDFWTNFCGPCKMMKPIFERITIENETDVQMYTMDVEENREFAMSLGIKAVPTIKGFSKGKEVYSQPGAKGENEITEIIKIVVNG